MTRRIGRLVAVPVLVAGLVAVGYAVTARPRAADQAAAAPPSATAPVVRGSVTERVQVPGTLGFTGAYSVIHQGAPGILTAAVAPGGVVDRGGVLYAVANQPVRLLFGDTPAYRDLAPGVANGPDVAQLERNLAALGQDPGRVDEHFTSATAAAVRRWQAALDLPAGQRTGVVRLGQVVFLPVAVRIGGRAAAIGTSVAPDSEVLTATSVDRVVTAQVTADRLTGLAPGDAVIVTPPGGRGVPGTVTAIGEVAAPADQQGPATAPVTVGLTAPVEGPARDQTPVQVAITVAAHQDVLLVPVAALLARPSGGYQVRLAAGEYVPVELGLFDEYAGTVEVSGPGLTEGRLVEVPAS